FLEVGFRCHRIAQRLIEGLRMRTGMRIVNPARLELVNIGKFVKGDLGRWHDLAPRLQYRGNGRNMREVMASEHEAPDEAGDINEALRYRAFLVRCRRQAIDTSS